MDGWRWRVGGAEPGQVEEYRRYTYTMAMVGECARPYLSDDSTDKSIYK